MCATLPPADRDWGTHWRNVALDSLALLSDAEASSHRARWTVIFAVEGPGPGMRCRCTITSVPPLAAQVATLSLAYRRYAKRMAAVVGGVRPFADGLRALSEAATCSPSTCMAVAAQQHQQVGELAAAMHRGSEAQYLAAMGLLADISLCANTVARAFWRCAGGLSGKGAAGAAACTLGAGADAVPMLRPCRPAIPDPCPSTCSLSAGIHQPDYPAILTAVLRLHQQRAQRLAEPAASRGST